MPVGAAIGMGVATIGSSIIGANAAGKAADAQVESSEAAIAEQRRQFDLARGDLAPWREAGGTAINLAGGEIYSSMQTGVIDAGFAKLRTISARYSLPSSWTQRFGLSRASLTVQADNVANLWLAQDESFGGPALGVGFERADVAYDARMDRDKRYSRFTTPGSRDRPIAGGNTFKRPLRPAV